MLVPVFVFLPPILGFTFGIRVNAVLPLQGPFLHELPLLGLSKVFIPLGVTNQVVDDACLWRWPCAHCMRQSLAHSINCRLDLLTRYEAIVTNGIMYDFELPGQSVYELVKLSC